ncbi:MAG: DUF3300 domain-containing protein [Candidatus Sulfotelmatobacter sp.]
MKTKLSKTLLTAVLTGAMAFGTGASLEAQDQSMDKPSAGVSVQVDQGPPPEQTAPQYSAPQYNAPQYNAPQYNEQDQGAPQDVAPPPPQDQDAYQDRAYQDQAQAPLPPPPTGPNQQQYTSLPPEQLNKLVAPIALYPDALVAQILAAAAYPTQIVEADRMARENPGLKGQDLANEVDRQDWDPSVKSLVEFPTVLANLDKNLSWTSELGEAYQNQPDDVMQAIQYMRHKAYDAGNLRTTPQERVYEQGPDVDIQPADPDVVYVPTYNPAYVYGYPVGLWPGFYPWWGVGFGGPYISFGIGFPLAPFFGFGWGWHGWGIGWGFHGGVFFGGHPWGYRGGAFYNHAAFVHGNYRGYSSARGGFGARGFAGRGYGSAAGHGYAGHGYAGRGYAGASRGYAGASRGFAGNRGAAVNRGAAGNRAYAGNRGFSGGNRAYAGNRGFSGSNRSFAGRGSSAPRAGNFSGGASRGFSSHGGGGSHGGGHFSGGHSSGGHASGGGGGHGGGGHGGRR